MEAAVAEASVEAVAAAVASEAAATAGEIAEAAVVVVGNPTLHPEKETGHAALKGA